MPSLGFSIVCKSDIADKVTKDLARGPLNHYFPGKRVTRGARIMESEPIELVGRGLVSPDVATLGFTLELAKDFIIASGASLVCAFIYDKLKKRAGKIDKITIEGKDIELSREDLEKVITAEIHRVLKSQQTES